MLNRNDFEKLRNEIVLNSLYLSDYTNSFNIDKDKVCDFFNSAIEFINDDYKAIHNKDIDACDIDIDSLYNYYLMFVDDPLKPDKKYFAKQLLNDDNYIFFENLKDDINENYSNEIFICWDHGGINNALIDTLKSSILNASDYEITYYYKNNLVAYIIDALKQYKKLNVKKAINIAKNLNKIWNKEIDRNDFICSVLKEMFNAQYLHRVIRGCCQGDYADIYYNSDTVNYDFIEYIEGVVFNTGFIIEVHDSDNIPTSADDISGYIDYIVYNGGLSFKECVAKNIGCKQDELVLYEIQDTYTITKVNYIEK